MLAVFRVEPAQQAPCREAPRSDDLPHGHRRIASELRPLGEVPERTAPRVAVCGFAVQDGGARARPLEPEEDAHERRLPTTVGTGDRDELALSECEAHVLEHELPRLIAEGDADELGR